MFKHLIRKILGRQPQAEKKIVSPYVGLTDAQIIERRRKIAVLYPTPPSREKLRESERAVQREADDMGFGLGLGLGVSAFHCDDSPAPAPSFEAGGGDFGGAGASEGFDSPSDSSPDAGGEA